MGHGLSVMVDNQQSPTNSPADPESPLQLGVVLGGVEVAMPESSTADYVEPRQTYLRRVYPLDARKLTEEQIAVAFAMTSRRPEPFDQIAEQVSQERAADFHERWVLGYGHSSVAEHAVLHLAVENISRLACDTLEDNRLASYTEKSSRYQLMPENYFHLPAELEDDRDLARLFVNTCIQLFQDYHRLVEACVDYLQGKYPQRERERHEAYRLRLRREATDSCRALLPAATLTNVGVTANARVLEHAISKLMSAGLDEERTLGEELRWQARAITPTLVKYADHNPYLAGSWRRESKAIHAEETRADGSTTAVDGGSGIPSTRLAGWDPQAEEKLAAALVYRQSSASYDEVWRWALGLAPEQRREIIAGAVAGLGPHDARYGNLRWLTTPLSSCWITGAYREFKRHRMQSYIPQPLSISLGRRVPDLVVEAGLAEQFSEALDPVEAAYLQVAQVFPLVSEYLVTHAHYRRVFTKMNLRECYHLFKLRTSNLAHSAIREPVLEAMRQVVGVQPELFRHLQLRDYPAWWPFSTGAS